MIHRLLPALFLLGCATSKPAVFDDLRALERQENYVEMIGKLKEVPPASRDTEWESFVEKATLHQLASFEIKDGSSGEDALKTMDEHLQAYPSLKKSATYLARRSEVGMKAFGWTFSNYRHSTSDERWVPQIVAFVEKDVTTKGLALKFGRDLVAERLVASSAWPLYEIAFKRDGDSVCADEKLPKVVLDAIDYESWLEQMKALVTQRCRSQLEKPVTEKLKKNDSTSFRRGACKILEGRAEFADATAVCKG